MNPTTDPEDEGRGGLDQRLDEEIRFHLDQQIEKNLRTGMSPEDARREAHLKFEGVERAREYSRDEFRFAWAHDFIRDVRIALRALLRKPSYATAVILTFGLGIGAIAARQIRITASASCSMAPESRRSDS